MFKRSISFILAILTIITVFSVLPVSAAQTNVSGSQQVNEEQVVAVGATEPGETQPATELHHATEPTQPSTAAVTEATEATQVTEVTEPTEPVEEKNYPMITSFENKTDGILVKWSAYDGAASYRLYYKNNNDGWTRMFTKNVTEYTDAAVKNGETRVYTVRACDKYGNFVSDYKSDGWSYTFYAPPVIKSLESSVDGVKLTWERAKGAQDYRLYRKTGNSSWTRIAKTDESSYTDKTVSSGVKYTYTLRMVTSDGESFMSSHNSGKSITFVAAPVIKNIENTSSGAVISWDKVKGADFYRIYYRNSSGGWTRLASKYLTEYTDTSVKSGVTRVYTIRCLNEDEDFVSDFNHTGWHNTFHAPPVIKELESTEDGVKITWDREKGAQDYRIYRKSGTSSWTRVVKTDASSFTDKSVTAGVNYTYTLRMVTSDGEKFMSGHNGGKSITFVSVPSIKSIENSAGGAVISWDKVKGADFYRIYYKNKSGGWTRLASKYLTEYTDTSVKDGETRVYTLRCLNEDEDFVSGFKSEGWSNTFYSAPKITTVSYSSGAYNIGWDKREGVAAYRLYRKTIGGSFSRLSDSITDNSYSDSTASKDKVYAYTLRYLDADGKLISGYISNVRYYMNGKPVNGNVFQNGTYGFKDGYLMTGLNRVSGKLRYYNSEGRMYRDTIVGNSSIGYYYTDEDGICCESEEMRLAAEFMAKYCKGSTLKEKMEYGFLYMANNYPYVRVYNDAPDDESDIPAFAIECFTDKEGTCYRYAAAFACVAKIAGYRSRFSYGISGTLLHGWTEVYVDGEWLMCDVDAQLPSYGYSDYAPYMMEYHIWTLDKYWSSELTLKDGKAVWGSIRYY